jgi:hypothetical protein
MENTDIFFHLPLECEKRDTSFTLKIPTAIPATTGNWSKQQIQNLFGQDSHGRRGKSINHTGTEGTEAACINASWQR